MEYETAVRDDRPEEHGGVGQFLVERGVVVVEAIEEALQRQRGVAAAAA